MQQLLLGTHIGEGGNDQAELLRPYSRLEVAHAWRMDNPFVKDDYELEVCVCVVQPFTANLSGFTHPCQPSHAQVRKLDQLRRRGLPIHPIQLAGCMQVCLRALVSIADRQIVASLKDSIEAGILLGGNVAIAYLLNLIKNPCKEQTDAQSTPTGRFHKPFLNHLALLARRIRGSRGLCVMGGSVGSSMKCYFFTVSPASQSPKKSSRQACPRNTLALARVVSLVWGSTWQVQL